MKTISGKITQVAINKISVQSIEGVTSTTRLSSKTIVTLNENKVTRTDLTTGQDIVITTWYGWAKTAAITPELLSVHVVNDVTARIKDRIPANSIRIFSTQDHTAQTYVRNSACWCSGITQQLTCLSPWNSTGANTRAGTAISPRHIIYANHYQIGVGATVRFVTANNEVINKTMINKTLAVSDLHIGLLDSDLPPSISFCKIAPANLTSYLPLSTIPGLQIPSLGLDQEEKALISVMRSDCAFAQPTVAAFLPYYESKIVGDSGNPAFLIINGELMLLTTWWYGGGGAGPSVYQSNAQINAAMTTLGGGYQATPMDLSRFKK